MFAGMAIKADLDSISTEDLYKVAALAEGFEEIPVSIDQFIDDPQYLGQIYGDGGVYPYWMEALRKIYPNPIYSPYEEVCVTGAIGVGKAVSSYTIIDCENGNKRACDVTLRDRVLGTDGRYHRLLGIFPQGVKHTYEFLISWVAEDGVAHDRVSSSDDHIWTVFSGEAWEDLTTVEIVHAMQQGARFTIPVLQGESTRMIKSYRDAGDADCICFSVDTPDHLFAVSNHTFTHNTTMALIGTLYDLYHVILLKNPHKKYKLLPTTQIVFSLITATMDLASAVMANQLLDAMGASPWFCEHFNPKKGERIDEDMFHNHIGIGYGSRGGHNLGKAVIGAVIDEANFQDKVANQAVDNYNTITRRMKSRFMLKGGTLPCRRWVISSRTDSAAFLESHIDAVRGKSNIIIFEPAIWDVQSVKGIYCGQTFPVFTGTTAEQPRILRTDEEVDNCAGYVIHVPVEYRDEFEEDLPKSLQDLAGVATRSGVNLIYDVEKLEESLCLDNCMATDEPHITLKGQDQLIDYYKKPLPPGQYFVHLDGAKSGDRYGVAFSRVTEQISLTRTSAIDGTEYSKLSPKVETPLAFGIKALPGSQVPFFKVRQFLCDLRSRGVNIQYVSADGYQSVDMLQLLEKLGFKCGYESADRTKDPYLKLAENVVLGLHKMPKSIVLKNELLNLQNLPNKVDHPLVIMVDGKQTKGGKDIADACCVSAFCAIGASMTLTQANMIEQMKAAPKRMSMKERQDYVMKNYLGLGS